MRLLISLMLVLGMDLYAQSSLPADLCLVREHPVYGKVATPFWSRAEGTWSADPLIIHLPSNDLCGVSDKCYLRPLEVMFLSSNSTAAQLLRYSNGLVDPEVIALSYGPDDAYLHGAAVGYDVFVMYGGYHACKVGLGTGNDAYHDHAVGATKKCHFYTVEAYPESQSGGWNKYRPDYLDDENQSGWVDISNCASQSFQPGGGGGHDPP